MLVEHRGKSPVIDETAAVAPTAIVSGDVEIGPETVVLAGAVITSEGAPVRIGAACVIMEHAVIRGAGRHPATLGDYVLVGPHSHVSGATVHDRVYIATGASVFNGALIESGSVVAVNAVVHIETQCPPDTLVPIGHIAAGDPARIVSPGNASEVHTELGRLGFSARVFGIDAGSLLDPATIEELCRRYSRSLARHRDDVFVGDAVMQQAAGIEQQDGHAATALEIAREQLGAEIVSVDALAGGFFSRAYAFSAGGREYVIRVNSELHAAGSFAKDDYAWRHFGSPALPIPEIVATGQRGELHFAIGERARGHSLSLFSRAERRRLVPELLDTLDAIAAVDVSESRGYGNWDGDGQGEHSSWREFLAAAIDDHAEGYYKHWQKLFRDSFLERDLYEAVYRRMVALSAECPEHRGLIHNDYQFGNVIADGAQITGVIDWANALYGDPLYDVAWLSWISIHPGWWFDDGDELLRARFGAAPDFETRLACYQCHVGLDHLRFYARNDRRADYDLCHDWLVALLDRTAG